MHKYKINLPALAVGSFFVAWIIYFTLFWSKAFWIDGSGNFIAGHVNLWGDWAAHFSMGSAFAYRDLWLTASPFLLGAKFSYPFFSDWISALLIRVGVDFVSAFVLPSFFFSVLLVFTLFFLYKNLFRSIYISLAATTIFLLNGGIGWYYWLQEGLPLPTHEYTRIDEQAIKWISVIDSMIIPQRAFNHGFTLATTALTLLVSVFFTKTTKKHRPSLQLIKLLLAALIMGSLPLVHTHSFLALFFILAIWFPINLYHQPKSWRRWLLLIITTGLLAAPIIMKFFLGHVDNNFFHWYPGWLAREYNMNWFIFWWKNWGLVPVTASLGWWLYSRQQGWIKHQLPALIWLPFFLIFIATNLILFQPFAWDNTKLIVWASVGFSGLTAYFLVTIWRQYRHILFKIALIVLFLFTIASGSLDAYWQLRHDLHHYEMYSAEEIKLANWVKTKTPVDAVWLTSPYHNNWLYNLTGRQSVMAYTGWLWTHGYDYYQTENDVIQMLSQPVLASDLFTQYGIDYVVIGPQELNNNHADLKYFLENATVVNRTEHYAIFQPPF